MKKAIPLLILLFLSVISSAQTQTKVAVKGEVIDSLTKETIPYATIKISEEKLPDKPLKVLSGNESGKFQAIIENEGNYILTVQYVGKKQFVKPFSIEAGTRQLDFGKIMMLDDIELAEVVVTAFKPLVTADLDKITYSMEDDPEAQTNNVLDMMKKVPMITVDAEDKIALKGSGNFKIHLDGKPSNMISSNPSQILKSMPANTVKRIEVITDPGAKYDAEGVGGIINIITNKQLLGGYTGSVNAGANSRGRYNGGVYLSAKYGKIGFTGNYNYHYYKNPANDSYTYREDYSNSNFKYFNQNGKSSNNGNGQFGSGELSYEIDTLNLISMSFNRYGGKGNSLSELDVEMDDINKNSVYSYNQNSKNSYTYGHTGMNVDYQRTFKKKDELLTASYLFSYSPNDSKSKSSIYNTFNFNKLEQNMYSDAATKEHTFQLDYTTPIAQIHTVEGGAKYIIRLNESVSAHDSLNFATNIWTPIKSDNDRFNHRQDILAAYLGYNLKVSKIGFKTGLRLEQTKLNAEYALNKSMNFSTDYFNLIPSAAFSYQLKQSQTLRLGYNMRVQRPGIWYLNPYVNSSDPKYVSHGNPNLDVEKSHSFSLNYSMFMQKLNFNASLFYSFTNNSIQNITEIRDDVSYSTYENIGKGRNAGVYIYGNWNPINLLRIYINVSENYMDIRANDNSGLSNHGFSESIFAGIQLSFPHNFTLNFNGGYTSPYIEIQGKSSGFNYTNIGLTKSFFNKKFNVTIGASDIFYKNKEYSSERSTGQFHYKSRNYYPGQDIRLSLSYRFGEMKQQIQKARRGINNDDTKSGESSGGGGGNSVGQ
ncbi:MAG: TonB-dependent receptor family protein [Dysgonamonadaceae bacterium]|jgi:outer membrane receptor protein involved in Fe transport|nr:TonB-dependent receptor family protein [Dysgonamonadaceae bacterium]